MGRLWCQDRPIVTVPRGPAKAVTLVYPYYEQPRFFRRQLDTWAAWPADVRAHIAILVVDDGSTRTPARTVLRPSDQVRLFEVEVDVRWNWLAARNIGFHYAAEGWVLVTDLDHVVGGTTAQSVVTGQHDPGVIYGCSRVDVRPDGTRVPIGPHPNSWLLTRTMFWRVGGYDETLSGHYGTDGDWRRRCAAVAPIQILADVLERHEYVEDSSTTIYRRKQPEDAAVSRLVKARRPGWSPRVLSFPHREVTA